MEHPEDSDAGFVRSILIIAVVGMGVLFFAAQCIAVGPK